MSDVIAQQAQPDRLPLYEASGCAMLHVRAPRAADYAAQVLDTAAPFLPRPPAEMDVLDVGCGYGHTAAALAHRCRRVVGIEPSRPLFEHARGLRDGGPDNLEFRNQGVDDLAEADAFDLVVLDNVLEHLPDQDKALRNVCRALRPGGVVFILVPNKLWPVEVHYRLPFLSYLPLPLANRYLRLTSRGTDYADASYAPTYWGLNRLLRRQPASFRYVLPAHPRLATHGGAWHYRLGVALLRRFPPLWALSKVFLVVGVKR